MKTSGPREVDSIDPAISLATNYTGTALLIISYHNFKYSPWKITTDKSILLGLHTDIIKVKYFDLRTSFQVRSSDFTHTRTELEIFNRSIQENNQCVITSY